jgi:hypothetical protein
MKKTTCCKESANLSTCRSTKLKKTLAASRLQACSSTISSSQTLLVLSAWQNSGSPARVQADITNAQQASRRLLFALVVGWSKIWVAHFHFISPLDQPPP